MKTRLNTKKREYRQGLEEYILECIESDDDDLKTAKDKLTYLINRFNTEYNTKHEKRRYPNLQKRLASYFQGLPFNFNYTNHDIWEVAKTLHNIEKLTEEEEDKILSNWWNHLAIHVIRMARDHSLDGLIK